MDETIHEPSARYTTNEVAARLFLSGPATRILLASGHVPFTRAGAYYLWDAHAVDSFIARLQATEARATPDSGGLRL